MDQHEMERRVASASVARLATVGADGRPHIVPICFALAERILYFAVDSKPKKTSNLKRLRNIAVNPAVSILVDHYEDDAAEKQKAIGLLVARYSQYRATKPAGPVVAVAIARMSGWSAT